MSSEKRGPTVSVGGVPIAFESDADLDALVMRLAARAGGTAPESGSGGRTNGAGGAPAANTQEGRDQTLLKMMVQAGDVGVEAATVARLLGGVQGRSVPVAVRRWAARVGLASEEDDKNVCVAARPNRKRGWKLSAGALGAARAMMGGEGQ